MEQLPSRVTSLLERPFLYLGFRLFIAVCCHMNVVLLIFYASCL